MEPFETLIIRDTTAVTKVFAYVEDLVREIHFLGKLRDSPHVVDVSDMKIEPFQFSMPIAKCDLHQYLTNNTISLNHKREICHGIACGVAHIQAAGIYHADYKLENVLMFGRVPKICDFAISHYHNKQSYIDFTLTYKAPELFLFGSDQYVAKEYTFAADIWALGVIFASVMRNTAFVLFGHLEEHKTYLTNIVKLLPGPEDVTEVYAKHCERFEQIPIKNEKNILETYFDGIVLSLLSNMLCLDPKERLTIDEVLEFPWFDGQVYKPLEFTKHETVEPTGALKDMSEIFIHCEAAKQAAAYYNTVKVTDDELMNALIAVRLAITLYCLDDVEDWADRIEENQLTDICDSDLIVMSRLVL